jgi:uncharacterized OB-fold protein
MADRIPIVDYLVLDESPHLEVSRCVNCDAAYFDRRNACASCGRTEFIKATVPNVGVVRTFTIVAMAAPGIDVPFVAAVIDCAGTDIRANLVNVPPDPEHVHLGMEVQLVTFPIGVDATGTEAIGFGFEPIEPGGKA